jgi:hypothetical protein
VQFALAEASSGEFLLLIWAMTRVMSLPCFAPLSEVSQGGARTPAALQHVLPMALQRRLSPSWRHGGVRLVSCP